MPRRQILIPVTIGEDYQTGLRARLHEYGILQRELCREMGIEESQFSRWIARPSSYTERAVSIGIDNVVKIEMAILAIRARRGKVEDEAKLPRGVRHRQRA